MELNAELRHQFRCHLSFHKTQIDLVRAAVEMVVFGHRALGKRTASPFILIQTPPLQFLNKPLPRRLSPLNYNTVF